MATYRQFLQNLAGTGGIPGKEASALLQVVGDDFGVNQNFLSNPYKYTGTEYGQVGAGYGPQGIQSLNQIYSTKYKSGAAPGYLNGGSTGGQSLSRPAGGGGVIGALTSSGGGSGYDPAADAYYNDQQRLAEQALGRIGNQRNIGNANIEGQYNGALNSLLGQQAQAQRDFQLQRGRTIEDNVNARAGVDSKVARQSQGLKRLLGQNSSAAQFAAPLAVARLGTEQQGQIQTAYSRNLQNLDLSKEDAERQAREKRAELDRQRESSRNQLESGLLNTEAQLNENLSNVALQRAQAKGQNYAQARASLTPYNDRVSNLLSQIDNLGRNPGIALNGEVKFAAPELQQYQVGDIGYSQGSAPAQQAAGQYYNLINDDERRRNGLI